MVCALIQSNHPHHTSRLVLMTTKPNNLLLHLTFRCDSESPLQWLHSLPSCVPQAAVARCARAWHTGIIVGFACSWIQDRPRVGVEVLSMHASTLAQIHGPKLQQPPSSKQPLRNKQPPTKQGLPSSSRQASQGLETCQVEPRASSGHGMQASIAGHSKRVHYGASQSHRICDVDGMLRSQARFLCRQPRYTKLGSRQSSAYVRHEHGRGRANGRP